MITENLVRQQIWYSQLTQVMQIADKPRENRTGKRTYRTDYVHDTDAFNEVNITF